MTELIYSCYNTNYKFFNETLFSVEFIDRKILHYFDLMIQTKKVKLTAKELFFILIKKYFKKKWGLYVCMLLVGAMVMSNGINDNDKFFIAFFFIYPLLVLFQFWRHVNSKDNKLLLAERHYQIDNEKINGILDKDTFSPIKLDHFIKIDLVNKTYLLYITKNQFIYIPINSFESDEDLQWFEKNIINTIKNRTS